MDNEDSWNPPWDCDSDADDDYASLSIKANFGSPFKNTQEYPFDDDNNDTRGEKEKGSAKKLLRFDSVEEEMEEIHNDTKSVASQDLKSFTQESPQNKKVRICFLLQCKYKIRTLSLDIL